VTGSKTTAQGKQKKLLKLFLFINNSLSFADRFSVSVSSEFIRKNEDDQAF
jgi:hypothetical protein